MSKRRAFTLVEILVVLAIIAILAALLFPAFGRVREGGRQANCASNLHQIYMATRQYFDDERRYPESIHDLLPEKTAIADVVSTGVATDSGASTGYLKGGNSLLKCLDDDTESVVPRCSYGNTAAVFDLPSGGFKNGLTAANEENSAIDPGRYVWNFWGYDNAGWSYLDSTEAEAAVTAACPTINTSTPCTKLPKETQNYDRLNNAIKFSMSNRFAPPQTIMTHCIYHRTSTSYAHYPGEVGVNDATLKDLCRGARDIVLRLDGSTKTTDVSTWADSGEWQTPKY